MLLFLLFVAIALSLPFVQTGIAHYAGNYLNKEFGTHIYIDKVAISIFGGVKLKGVLIMDHHNDTLASANRLQTNVLNFRAIAQSNLKFGTIRAEKLNFHMKTYKGENSSNLDVFVKSFDNGKPGSGKFRLRSGRLFVTNGRYRLTNENAVTPRVLDFKKLNGELKDFYIKGGDVSADIKKLSLLDHRGLFVKNLKAGFSYTKTNIKLKDLELVTAESVLKGHVTLTYTREQMKDFINKVKFDFAVNRATISSNELNYFYNEFGKNQKYYLSTTLKGPLNNFVLYNLKLLDGNDSEIIGSVNFRHLFDKKGPGFYMNGDFDRITSNYENLKAIMPRILGNSLPVLLGKFGRVDMVGHATLTKQDIDTRMYIMSGLGEANANFSVKDYNKPSEAAYTGTIDLTDFNLGAIADVKTIGNTTLHLDIDGRGFNKESLNTTVSGDITGFTYNKYVYKNITVDGRFKWPYFKGKVNSNDPNLLMSFDGLVDMGKKKKEFDFHAQVDYADLVALKLMKKDTLSIFKGDLIFDAKGNNINDIAGKLQISRLSYQNSKDSYYFEDFFVASSFDENNVRALTVNSTDIIDGRVTGKFDVGQLPKLMENAVGSLYTNYSPHKLKKGQYLDFDLTIYNKVVEIVLPEVTVGQNTRLRGKVNSDRGEFKLAFNSPEITAYNNYFNNISIDVDNKNPLYNAYVSIDSARTKGYKVTDFSLINITRNDTLYVRTEFKGGKKAADLFKLNLFHTIDKDRNSVVGFKKSEINFKDFQWFINENDTKDNKIIFNKKLTNFSVDKISMSHNDQRVEVSGILRDSTYKDVRLSFNDVDLRKITPTLDSLNFGGRLNGEVSLKQNRNEFTPASSLTIDTLRINQHNLGDMSLQVTGDRSLRKFNINTTLTKDDKETFATSGNIEIVDKQTLLSLDATFSDFDLSPLEVFLKTIFPEIRGKASGRAAIVGNAKKPEIDGRLYIKGGGLRVGYLNTDFNFEENATVDLTEELIFFRNIELTDSKYKTKGRLNGSLKHDFFKNWGLDLKITSDRLLVLDTKDSDDALYYGTAFIKGEATLTGPTTALVIDVNAESAKDTDIKLNINNTGATGTNNAAFIHFLSPQEKLNKGKGVVAKDAKVYKGLELNFELNITPDAKLEVVIDKNTGHSLTATGDGLMLLNINTLGKFNMWGDYSVRQGQYNFKYGGLFDKKFVVKEGGSIVWEGDPTKAKLNLEAVYKTQANPSVLLESASFSRSIPVEVAITLNGNITAPEPDFNINFPGVSSTLKSDLDYKLSDMDTRQTQALSLLSTGSFISQTNASTAVYGSLFERASSMFNDLFTDEQSKVKVGVNYVQADRNPYVETNSQFGLTLSSQINDRITVNGVLGVPVGGVNQSAVVGNVEVQLRLNDDGTFKARVFNRENDINFLGEGIGYTQGVGLTWDVDFDTFSELIWKVFKKAKNDEPDNNNRGTDIPDSELAPDYIQFGDSRNKKKGTDEDKEPERIPETD
ncbi:translocation/assembly module TamB domain-containing protein [Flavobacterium sp. Sd200]|uniref:translocation/assembly module TamB domain-containing protein n=1 Tax=Flavobacterium sp. Sd200 TaxID=2692211 RepID=UPI001F46B04A|nr:translocation/assembly module TamB domain-containing protein [Flavobacterium sp. Sd200]